MKMTLKRALTSLLILVMLFQLVSIVEVPKVAADTDFDYSASITPTTTINKNDTFNLSPTFINRSGGNLTNVSIVLDTTNSAFITVSGDTQLGFSANLANNAQLTITNSLFKYLGGTDKRLSLTIKYTKAGVPSEVSKTIGINAIDPSEIPVSSPTDTKKFVPKLVIQPITTQTVNAGDTFILTFPIKNTNVYAASDITVIPTIEKDDNLIFLDDSNASKSISKLDQNAIQNVSFQFRTSSNATTKSYPIKITMDYNNPFGDSFSTSSIVYVKVIAQQATVSDIEITSVNGSKDTVAPGDNNNISVNVKNTGTALLKDIKVTTTGSKDDMISLASGASKKTIESLAPGATANVSFTLLASKKAADGNYSVTIKVDGKDTSDKTVSDDQTYFMNVLNNMTSDIEMTDFTAYPQKIQAGEDTYLDVVVRNRGNSKLSDVKCTLSGFKEDTLAISDGTNKKTIQSIEAGMIKRFKFTMSSSKKAIDGNYIINAKIEAKDSTNKIISDDKSLYVAINQIKTLPSVDNTSIEISDLKFPNTALTSSAEFTLGFNVINNGEDKVKDIKVTLTPDPLLIAKTPTISNITSIVKNGKIHFTYLFKIPKNAIDKNYPIQIAAEYETLVNGQKSKHLVNQYTNVYVENPPKPTKKPNKPTKTVKSVPKLIVSNYSIDPSMAKAGKNIKLHISFLNTSSLKKVQNIKIFLTADGVQTDSGNVFVPVNGSNTFYIDKIDQKQMITQSLELYVVNDAKPKTYNLNVNFEYEDEQGNEYKALETIGIPVRSQTKLDTSTFTLPTEVSLIDPLIISFDMYNTGKSILRNLMLKAEGNFDVQNQNSYIGNLDIGNQEHYEATLVPKGPGALKGAVVISFEDSVGQIQVIRKEFSTNVINPPPVVNPEGDKGGDMPVQEDSKPNLLILIGGIGGGVLVVGIVVFIIIKKRRKRKLEEMFLSE